MMNSKQPFSGTKVIENLLDLLNEDTMQREIDEPLDAAKQSFRIEPSDTISHLKFNQVIAAFIQHIYNEGSRLNRYLSYQEALAEAILLLQRYYPNEYKEGYTTALIDASSGGREGLELVLSELTESVKVVEREKYIQWAFTTNIDHLDWGLRCRIVDAYIQKNKELLPGHFSDIDPARLTDFIHNLIFNHMAADNMVRQSFSAKRELSAIISNVDL